MVKIACLPKLGSELIETQPRFYIKKERKEKVMIIYNKIYGASRLPKTSKNDCFAVYMVIETVATRKVQMKNKQANEQKATKHILIVILVTLFWTAQNLKKGKTETMILGTAKRLSCL